MKPRSARIAALLLACASGAQARDHLVTANPDLTFTPDNLVIYQNDRVIFQNAGGVHNVVADDHRFKCSVNCNTNTTPSALAWTATIQFTHLGSIGYFCEQHGDTQTGMRGLITVIDRVFVDGFEAAP